MKVGIIGCGNISRIYLENAPRFANYTIEAVADLVVERAEERAKEYGILKAYSTDALLNDPEIELVINLTIPAVHADIAKRALKQGKHVYGEKPLAVALEDGEEMLKLAQEKGLYLGNAPDTSLGAGIQTVRKLIDEGEIGEPLSASAFMMGPGHESWHPDPAFYYKQGGGPMFDMGPYYLTTLIHLLGPAARVTGSAQISSTERTITSQPKRGEKIEVEVPTQVNSVIDFERGTVVSLIMSFDVQAHQLPHMEIYGTKGTISVPDPNTFAGPVRMKTHDQQEWKEVPLVAGYADNSRGLGVAEMVAAIKKQKVSRVTGEVGYHVLEIMHGVHHASTEQKHVILSSSCKQPEAFVNESF
ncbi:MULTISPECIES: Gfo/Idh/MocA family protein [Gracilibacillus]|uniref:Gfo/Idh/MocA family protein n=1 Tax=Gracilibacillus TaxID=74385 RepID=UPI00082672E3|nr:MULTISPECIES: Gfo/Idh/MocA family oxidoreductase [Gracilibacillus]